MKAFLSIILTFVISLSSITVLTSCAKSEYNVDAYASSVHAAANIPSVSQSTGAKAEASAAPRERKSSTPREIDSELQTMLKEKMKDTNFSGVALVSKNGTIVCEAANGTMSLDSKKKIKKDTLFAIASCSKQLTAACVLLLKEDGKLKLSDTIDKYFPKYKYGDRITVKMLMNMRSGIADFLNDSASFKKYDLSKDADESQNRKLTRNWIMKRELNYLPDRVFYYSNSNYFLLAEIVEKVSKMSFAQFLRERILVPLDMADTDVSEELGYSNRLALSEPDPWDLMDLNPEKRPLAVQIKGLCVGCGGLISTAEDMDKWLTSLRENTILSKKSVKIMTTDYSTYADHYGYGVYIDSDGGIWHVGALDYYVSYAYTNPKTGYNFFAATNNKTLMNCDIYTFAHSIIDNTK